VEQRAADFVEIMIVFAVIGVLAFLIALLVRTPARQQPAAAGTAAPPQPPRWYEFALALILLAAAAALAIWLISSGKQWPWGEAIGDWQADTRTVVFAALMVALAVVGLGLSLAYALVQSSRAAPPQRAAPVTADAAPAAGAEPSPSPLRVLGLLALLIAVLLLCWIGLPPAAQYALLTQLVFPASFGVALVLLFDKATRSWDQKTGAAAFREWLFCDLLIFLLVIAFLNARGVAKPEAYAASFWDLLNVLLFFIAFWIVDRTAAPSRFLFGYGYLVVLPLLLLIWNAVQGVPDAASWWASIWPFLILAALFFVLEAVTVVVAAGGRQTLPAIKDTLFVLLYAVLLIVATRAHA
jgi:hypothetical protein